MEKQENFEEQTGIDLNTYLIVAEVEELMKDFRSKLNDIIVKTYKSGYDRAIQKMLEIFEKEGMKIGKLTKNSYL